MPRTESQIQIRISPVTKEALSELLGERQAGDRVNEVAAELEAVEVNKLLAAEQKPPGKYATLHITPTPDVLLRAEHLYLDVKRLLRAAACKVAQEKSGSSDR